MLVIIFHLLLLYKKQIVMQTLQQNLEIILNAVEPEIADLVAMNITSFEKKFKRKATHRDIEYIEYAVTIDLINACARYILPTDEVEVTNYGTSKGVVTFGCKVTREGTAYYMSTRMIIAEGEIQCRHYRYLVSTSLPAIKSPLETARLKAKVAGMKKEDKILEEIDRIKENLQKEIDKFIALCNKTEEEVLADSYLNDCKWERLNEFAVKHYVTEEAYYAHVAQQVKECLAKHELRTSSAAITNRIKEENKRITKLTLKLNEIKY